jgi:hypothetical protein
LPLREMRLQVDAELLRVTVAPACSVHDVELNVALSSYIATDTARFVSFDPSKGEVGVMPLGDLPRAFAAEVREIIDASEIKAAFPT